MLLNYSPIVGRVAPEAQLSRVQPRWQRSPPSFHTISKLSLTVLLFLNSKYLEYLFIVFHKGASHPGPWLLCHDVVRLERGRHSRCHQPRQPNYPMRFRHRRLPGKLPRAPVRTSSLTTSPHKHIRISRRARPDSRYRGTEIRGLLLPRDSSAFLRKD